MTYRCVALGKANCEDTEAADSIAVQHIFALFLVLCLRFYHQKSLKNSTELWPFFDDFISFGDCFFINFEVIFPPGGTPGGTPGAS